MRIKTEHGHTDVRFADFVAVNAAVEQVRAGYRKACAEKPEKKDTHKEKVEGWASKYFGNNRYFKDFDAAVGGATGSEAVRLWDEWIASQPITHRKLYYDPRIVAACIMGEDE